MNRNNKSQHEGALKLRYYDLLFFLLLSVFLSSCLPAPAHKTGSTINSQIIQQQSNPLYTARLSSFMSLKDDQGPVIRLEIAGIEIKTNDLWLNLTNVPLSIDSAEIGTGQLFLGGQPLPPGRYQRLRFTITQGEIRTGSGQYVAVAAEPFEVEIDLNSELVLEPDDSKSLLITWDLINSLRPNNILVPDLTAAPPLKQMLINMLFVSCPDINTVFVIRTDKNWVVDSFGLSGGPTYMAIDPNNNQSLYVLASRERTIKVVDLSSYRVINFFPVPLNDEPTFMVTSPDGRSGFLLDEQNGYLSRINLTTGQSEARIMLNYRPRYAVFLPEQNLLAVSLSLSQKVVLLDPVKLQILGTISTGSEPQGLAVSDNKLFIAEYGDNTIAVIDLSARQNQQRFNVGFGPRRLQNADNQVYISNYLEGSLSVMVSDQLTQEIFGLDSPLEMSYNNAYLRLYVADEKRGGLSVIDTNSNRLQENITLGTRPFDLEMIQ